MKVRLAIWLILSALVSHPTLQAQSRGNKISIYAGPEFPLGSFSETHWAGISSGIEYRPGKPQTLQFILGSRISYYLGRKETVSGYPYRYGGYAAWGAYGGLQYQFKQPLRVSWMTGPAVSYYRKTARFNVGSVLDLHWKISQHWGIGPGISFLKENGATFLWSAGLKAVLTR